MPGCDTRIRLPCSPLIPCQAFRIPSTSVPLEVHTLEGHRMDAVSISLIATVTTLCTTALR